MNQCAIQQSCVIRSREEQQQQRSRRSSITTTSLMFSVDNLNLNRPTMNNLVCPKPRRVSLLNGSLNDNNDSRSLPWPNIHHQTEISEKAGSELLNLILSRGGGEAGGGINSTHNTTVQIAVAVPSSSSPGPFFIGSPPSRVSNPLTQDAVFKEAGNNNNNNENNAANNSNFLNFSLTNNTTRYSSTTSVCGRRGGGGSRGSPDGSAASTITSSSSTSPTVATPNYYYPNSAGGGARKGSGCVRENFGNNPAVRIEGFDCLDRDNSRRNSCSIATLA